MTRILLILLLGACAHHEPPIPPEENIICEEPKQLSYLGVLYEPKDVTIDKKTYFAHEVLYVYPGSPAEKAGLQIDDLIFSIDGKTLPKDSTKRREFFSNIIKNFPLKTNFDLQFIRKNISYNNRPHFEYNLLPTLEKTLDETKDSSFVKIELKRNYKFFKKIVTLNPRSYRMGSKHFDKNYLEFDKASDISFSSLLRTEGQKKSLCDLRKRLSDLSNSSDDYGLNIVSILQKNPSFHQSILKEILPKTSSPKDIFDLYAKLFEIEDFSWPSPLESLEKIYNSSLEHYNNGIKNLSLEEQNFITKNTENFLSSIEKNIYLNEKVNLRDMPNNLKILELLRKVNLQEMLLSAAYLYQMNDFALENKDSLLKSLQEKPNLRIKKSLGDILISGTQDDYHDEDSVSMFIDLGGNDRYLLKPDSKLKVIIDLSGDDIYQGSSLFSLVGSVLGISFLIDHQGNDQYIAQDASLGFSIGGIAILEDKEGNDYYKSNLYSQGAAFQGLGLLVDSEGNDHYFSNGFSQGVGFPGGLGILLDKAGDDHYTSEGNIKSSYGDEGIFQSFSQGVGMGLRSFASGGIGILKDIKGKDHFVAGEFSQGAGYYFGWGILANLGNDSDRYIGSRYSQGAAAHYAIGTFLEEGGDDFYLPTHSVSNGIAWDLSLAYFIDKSGDDHYQTQGISLGYSAHNSISYFRDINGKDLYDYSFPPASFAKESDHGGISLGIFEDDDSNNNFFKEKFSPFEEKKDIGIGIRILK